MKSVVAALLAVAAVGAQGKPVRPHTRQIFVGVRDRSGAPVLDLQPADFDVTEQGVRREVVRAALAKDPMRVALLVDTSDGAEKALHDIRAGLTAFADALPSPHELMLVTTGRQPRVRVQPTADRKKFKDTAGGIFSEGGTTTLSDTLMDIDDRFFRKAEDRWPVFVIVTGDGGEASAAANERKFTEWLQGLPARGVTADGIAIKYRGGGTPEVITQHVVEQAAGRYDYVNTSNSLPEKLKAFADQLARDYEQASTRYVIAYVTDAAANGPVSVGVDRDGVVLEMSSRRAR